MDKNYLNEHKLTEAQRRFQTILEYTYSSSPILGEDDPNNAPGGAPAGDPNAASMGGDPSMGGAPNGGGMPPMGGAPNGGGMSPMGDGPAGDPSAAADGGNASAGVEGLNPMGGDPGMGGGMPMEQPEDDVEEIDVDELVDKEDETNIKVGKLENKIESLIKMIDKFEADIDQNNQHIDQLKQEFEKRNPTQVEKLTLRSKQGDPFTQAPNAYWDAKSAEGNYSPESDNNGVGDARYAVENEPPKFEITQNDINAINDWDSIYKSINDGTFHQDLNHLLNF